MGIKLKFILLPALVFASLVACSKDDASKLRPNPLPGGEDAFAKLSYTSNADSLFLSWELTDKSTAFDRYRFSTDKSDRVVEVGKAETECFLTHVPYDQPVKVSVALMRGNETVKSLSTNIRIDGLDKVTAGIIIPDRGSVTAGDGMYSIPLPDGRSIFLMGDSYTGPVTNNQRSTSDHMYRNTYILYDEGTVSALSEVNGKNTSAAVPPESPNESKWYWPGHGFARDNKLYIFQTVMYQGGEGMWGFMYERTDILEYDLPGVTLNKTTRVPFSGSADIHYGMAVLDDDADYIYIYAQVDVRNDANPISEVLVARTTLDKLYTDWEYYTGSGWSTDSGAAVKLSGLASVPVSSQFNVFKLRNKYVLLTQSKRFNSGEIYTFTSDTPYGPWGNKKLLFKTYEQNVKNLLTYNAMAHPQFEKDGMILISYNVNTEVFSQQFSDVSTYRPRFFWAEINTILNN